LKRSTRAAKAAKSAHGSARQGAEAARKSETRGRGLEGKSSRVQRLGFALLDLIVRGRGPKGPEGAHEVRRQSPSAARKTETGSRGLEGKSSRAH